MIAQPGQRRRWAILAFAQIANLYLAFFSLDAALSIFHEIVQQFGIGTDPDSFLALLRNGVAAGVVLASFVMIYVLLFVPQLPRSVFIPLIVFALWCEVGARGVPRGALGDYLGLALASAQGVFALTALGLLYARNGQPRVLIDTLPIRRHMVLRTFAAIATAIIATPILFAVLTIFANVDAIERGTDGYLQFGLTALHTKETILVKGDQKVFLIATMHLGEPGFYQSMRDAMSDGSLVLAEGVTDREGKLSAKLSYSGLARALGLSTQGAIEDWDESKGDGPAREAEGNEKPPVPGKPKPTDKTAPPSRLDIERADIDIADFRPSTITFLGQVAELYASRSADEAVERMKALNEADPKIAKDALDDILNKRNAHLLTVFDAKAPGHKSIVIPWGALHMPAIRDALLQRGFVVASDEVHTVFHYRTLFDRLLNRNGAPHDAEAS